MCNLSSGVLERGIEQGIAQGIEQGIAQGIEQGIEQGMAQGIEQGKIEDLKNIMKNLKLTFEEAANAINIPEEKRAEYMAKI